MALTRAVAGAAVLVADAGPPLMPSGDEARRWAEQELSDPAYAAAQPTAFDRIAQAIGDFVRGILTARLPDGAGSAFAIVAAILVVALAIAAILVWGLPRTTARSRPDTAELFGEPERRSAARLRALAASSAAQAEWDAAIVLRFRALARGLEERGILETPPGATVHAFARAAGRPFPDWAAALEGAAGVFDDVRYLRHPSTEDMYRRVSSVDDALSAARPVVVEESPA